MANRVQLSSPREAEQYILNMVRWNYMVTEKNTFKEVSQSIKSKVSLGWMALILMVSLKLNDTGLWFSIWMKKLVEKGDKWPILVVPLSCSKLAECLHVAFISVEKHCPVIFFGWVALCFKKNKVCKKNPLVFQVASFVYVLWNEEQNKPLQLINCWTANRQTFFYCMKWKSINIFLRFHVAKDQYFAKF